MLKMNKMDLIFEEAVFSRNKNLHVIYTATMRHLKIAGESDVIGVAMATFTFQYGRYLSYKKMYLENEFSDPHFLFSKTISYCTINSLTNLKKKC